MTRAGSPNYKIRSPKRGKPARDWYSLRASLGHWPVVSCLKSTDHRLAIRWSLYHVGHRLSNAVRDPTENARGLD